MKKKRTYQILTSAVLVISLIGILTGILIINKKIKITPILASKFEVTGVDVSHYQGTIDWMKLAEQNLDFAFIKATEGSSHIDECFYDNWHEAGKTGLCIGAYHFFSFDSDGETQAQLYIDTVGNLNGKMAPVVDVEFYGDKESNPPPKDEAVKQLGDMLSALEDCYHVKPVIYTTYKAYNSYIKGEFEEYPLWIRNVYYQPFITGNKWTFWQYTDTAVLDGYKGAEKYIDMNVFRGTREELKELIVQCEDDDLSMDEELSESENLSLEEVEFEIPDSFLLWDEEAGKDVEIPLEHCNLIYDTKQVKVYSYLGLTRTLFIITPKSETVVSPVKNFWLDEEQDAIWLLDSKEAVQIRKIDLRQEHFLEETLILDMEAMEVLIADTYGLSMEADKTFFQNLNVYLSGREKDGEISLRGSISGIYKDTNKKFEIVYEIDRVSGEVSAKGYLQALAIHPLYQEFLFNNLTVDNPFAENETKLGKKLSYFDDEVYLSESGNYHKQFAVADIDGNGELEFLFDLNQIDGKEEFVYVFAEKNGELICRDIMNAALAEDLKTNTIKWFDCASFSEIPIENCKEYKSRDEVFSAIENGDFSVIVSKYSDPYGSGEEMNIVDEIKYVIEKDKGITERSDIDGDGFDELLILIKYEPEAEEYERIDFILDYRNGSAVCLYYDWCDGSEYLFLGEEEKLIQYLHSSNGSCTYYGLYECTLNARGIKDIDYTGYGIEVINVYESDASGFWWWEGQLPEITQTGTYYTRARFKNAEEINAADTAGEWIKELITKEQFLKEYKKLTGKEYRVQGAT